NSLSKILATSAPTSSNSPPVGASTAFHQIQTHSPANAATSNSTSLPSTRTNACSTASPSPSSNGAAHSPSSRHIAAPKPFTTTSSATSPNAAIRWAGASTPSRFRRPSNKASSKKSTPSPTPKIPARLSSRAFTPNALTRNNGFRNTAALLLTN